MPDLRCRCPAPLDGDHLVTRTSWCDPSCRLRALLLCFSSPCRHGPAASTADGRTVCRHASDRSRSCRAARKAGQIGLMQRASWHRSAACCSFSPRSPSIACGCGTPCCRSRWPFLTRKASSSMSRTCSRKPTTTIAASRPARYALEMNLGWFRSRGFAAGLAITGVEKAGSATLSLASRAGLRPSVVRWNVIARSAVRRSIPPACASLVQFAQLSLQANPFAVAAGEIPFDSAPRCASSQWLSLISSS
jgi:hypothetical protein